LTEQVFDWLLMDHQDKLARPTFLRPCVSFGRLLQLACTDAGDHMHPQLLCGVHGGAADASKRPGYNEGLPILRMRSQPTFGRTGGL
jgi:hypothetical protein